MPEMRELSSRDIDGLVEVRFNVVHDRGEVPAVAWLPQQLGAPVVLLGHGGSGHKTIARHQRHALRLAQADGLACVAIDGPFHGDRATPGDGTLGYQQRVLDEGPQWVHSRMSEDWLATLEIATGAWGLDGDRVGYLGLSMGARYGLGVCAQLGPRLKVTVLGKFGLTAPDPMMEAMAAGGLLRESALGINAPVLQHVQWDDEIFPLPGQLELFDLFPSPEKTLRARPGLHHHTRPDDEDAWCDYLVRHLCQPRRPQGSPAR